MSNSSKLTIGLFGFGVVGEGLYKSLQQAPHLNASIKKIVIKNSNKPRNAPATLFSTNKEAILADEEINVVVEVINESDAAYEIVTRSIQSGKKVVSASKKMIAENYAQLLQLADTHNGNFLYESAVCASIPVIRNLEEYYNNDFLKQVSGIVNGSTNFILQKIFEEQLSFEAALQLAQELGFAEIDPALDVDGIDALHKLVILLAHAYGIVAKPEVILHRGIRSVSAQDAAFAKQRNATIKLIANAKQLNNGSIAAYVLPTIVSKEHQFAFVKNEFNGVLIQSALADEQFFFGKGAGSFPTASAVLSDISALSYNYKYEYNKLNQKNGATLAVDFLLRVYVSYPKPQPIAFTDFKSISTNHQEDDYCYVTGIISHQQLQSSAWLGRQDVSLLVLGDGIIDTTTKL